MYFSTKKGPQGHCLKIHKVLNNHLSVYESSFTYIKVSTRQHLKACGRTPREVCKLSVHYLAGTEGLKGKASWGPRSFPGRSPCSFPGFSTRLQAWIPVCLPNLYPNIFPFTIVSSRLPSTIVFLLIWGRQRTHREACCSVSCLFTLGISPQSLLICPAAERGAELCDTIYSEMRKE